MQKLFKWFGIAILSVSAGQLHAEESYGKPEDPVVTYTPSFDCAKAGTLSEKLICKDEVLSKLDSTLTKVYKSAYRAYPENEKKDLVSEQKVWIKHRDGCTSSSVAISCMTRAYESRISQLQIAGGLVEVPEAVYYKCDGKKENTLTVYFYNTTQIPTVVLNLPLKQEMAYSSMSGSGAKYTSEDIEFWEHHGEATLKHNGRTLKCKEFTNR